MAEPTFWIVLTVIGIAFGYDTAFTGATAEMAKSIGTPETWRMVQDAITPPGAGRLGCVVQTIAGVAPLVSWLLFDWKRALLAFLYLVLVGGFTLMALTLAAKTHYRTRVLRSLVNRYADYRRDGDHLRAIAAADYLERLGMPAP